MTKNNLLNNPIQTLKGIGTERAKLFNKINISTIENLIYHYPREYEDRSTLKNIIDLIPEESSVFKGIITSKVKEIRTRSGLTLLSVQVKDHTNTVTINWFNQTYLKYVFKINSEYYFFGKVSNSTSGLTVQNPVYEQTSSKDAKDFLKILSIYHSTKKLSQNIIRGCIKKAFEQITAPIENTLPLEIMEKYDLIDTNIALRTLHFPANFKELTIARKTLVFEELLNLQLSLLNIKNSNSKKKQGIQFESSKAEICSFLDNLPFSLTKSQYNSLLEIEKDMESNFAMNRLLQGDVGSGKTIIAILALFKAVKSGFQGTLMVPTEILAKQHFKSVTELLLSHDIKVAILVGSQTKKEKNKIKDHLLTGNIDILIGTHALIQEDVEFSRLGIVITDEQHRFGVRQRSLLSKKGVNPDVLVMSATPIPRTLALILYGDLDISIINELPPGRIPIETYAVNENKRERINSFIQKTIEEGSQVYVVCPLIEESETLELSSATEVYENLKAVNMPNVEFELLHGKMKNKQKDAIMNDFINKKIHVLVSTTVIEVGVNIPNANIMIIENAERFGLLQLHQLRGRVGRGHKKSYCILFNQSQKEYAKKRLDVLEKSNDGFVISEKDLDLRGPGDFFGTRQHGLPQLKIANLYEDIDVLKKAQEAANYIINSPELFAQFKIRDLNDIEL